MSDEAIGFVLRHEYGRLIAALMREFGAHRIATVEDGLSQAMVEATMQWRTRGVPANARAWIHRAARHRIIDALRRTRREDELDDGADLGSYTLPEAALSSDLHDDELRALYACAESSIPLPSQIAFALRTLSGFSIKEIATRLVTSEENVQKRVERAREAMRHVDLSQDLEPTELEHRTESVLRMIYVLFTEGYFASTGEAVLRLELCEEAIRLGGLVARHPRTRSHSAWALLALMHFHHARRDARTDVDGLPVLLEDQDRTRYRQAELQLGFDAIRRIPPDAAPTKYTLEAAIAGEHAFAPTFAETRWSVITQHYDRLQALEPSPLHVLHGAIALSYSSGPLAALAKLDALAPPTWLLGSHLWLATYADLARRLDRRDDAIRYYEQAIALAPAFEKRVLERRLRDYRASGTEVG